MNKIILLSAICLFTNIYGVRAADTLPQIFDRNVKTLSVRNLNKFTYPAVIRLGTDDRLNINFDIIGEQHRYLRYKILHCNADWQHSRLLESEYVEGFNEAEIWDYAYSENTFVHYINYNIEIPNADLKIIRSGNYLLQVYDEDSPEIVILQTRFSVSDNVSGIDAVATSRTDKGFNTEYQQLSIMVDGVSLGNINPYQDLIVAITQNNRPETMKIITHPMRVDGQKIVYEHDPSLVFDGGNEFRRFETVRTDYPGMSVDSVKFMGTNWHAYLHVDKIRADRDYNYDQTQNGRFMVDDYNSTDPDLGADYVTVHFTLEAPEIINGEVYIGGDFTLNNYTVSNKMIYDYDTRLYSAEIPLKQGSYNYQYLVKARNNDIPDASVIEGNKYETRNEYLIQLFLRKPGSRGDALIGTSQIIF